jgi:osmotically-inducible protein OsmY
VTGTTGEPSADYLAEDIHQRLAEDPRVAELGIQVAVTAGQVFLRGTVGTEDRRRAAAAVVAELLPGRRLHNHISVCDTPEPTDTEHLS